MSSIPQVSFVLPCYNYGRFLPDCLGSIFRQEGDWNFEVIAVDDASTDNTAEVLARFTDPRLRVVRHERNLGHAQAFTTGLLAARAELIARIDPDDRYRASFLNRTVPAFAKYPEVGMVYGDTSMIGEDGRENAPRCDRQHGGRDFKGCELIELLESNFICAPTIIARRECWLRQLPIPAHLAFHDWYFTIRMARETEFYYLNSVLADYRVHSANLHSRIVLDKSEERSIFWFLDEIYAMEEGSPDLQQRKLKARRRVYGAHYLTTAEKYFGAHMNADARRCYLSAVRHRPSCSVSFGVLRRLAATLVGRGAYERAKAIFKQRAGVIPGAPTNAV